MGGRYGKGAGRVALAGVLTALSLVILYLASMAPTGRLGVVALAGLPAFMEQLWALYLVGNVVFVIYDYGFSKLISFYVQRIDKAVRKA